MSTSQLGSLEALVEMAKEPSSERRRALLRNITSVFMLHPEEVTASEMELYDDVMSRLAQDMETVVRAEIAHTIADSRNAPLGLLRSLAADHIEVAEPILTRSKALSEDDLLHIVSTQGQGHLRAVSRRAEVPESVSGIIVNRGDDDTLNTLLRNEGARLSRTASEQVVERAQSNPALHEAVVTRRDLPADLLNDMYFVVEAQLRERIIAENAKLDAATLDKVMSKSRDRVAVAYGSYPADYEHISTEIEKLRKADQLTPTLLARYMRDPNPTWFLVALSQMADLDFLTARHLVEKREVDGLAIACKAADLDKALFLTYVVILLSDSDNAMGRAAEYGRLYEQLPKETAMRTIRFWRLRRTEAHAA